MSQGEKIIAYVDKTVMMITGLSVKGLNTERLEEILFEKFGSPARVIGVTGDRIEMDVYGVEPGDILRDEDAVISAVALAEGITLTELAEIARAEKIVEIDYQSASLPEGVYCPRELWRKP